MDSTFARDYEYEEIDELPSSASLPHYYYPGTTTWSETRIAVPVPRPPTDGVLIKVIPPRGVPWIGTFAFGIVSRNGVTRVLTTPNPDVLCVAAKGAGYLVSASDPRTWKTVRAHPVLDVRQIPASRLVVFADFTDLVAYGADGIAWETERLGADDVKITDVSADEIHGTWWNPATQSTASFIVDLKTGVLKGGTSYSRM